MQTSRSQKYTYGIVGGIFPDPANPSSSLIISSPNMMSLPNPLVHTQRVIRVLKDGKWGVDDATLHPQVFRKATAHLPLMLAPKLGTPGSKRAILHAELAEEDWIPKYMDPSFGTIDERLASTLEEESFAVIKRFEDALWTAEGSDPDSVSSLSTCKGIVRSFKNAVNRLSIPGARSDCVWVWSSVQRFLLDITAFLDWHDTYRHLYRDSPNEPLPVDTNRLGAITSDHESAEVLFKAGLPTYFIRRLGEVDLTTDIKHLLSDNVMKAVLSSTVIVASGQQVGSSSAIVILKPSRADPSPIIFRGDAKSPHRLAAMTAWLRRDHPLQHPQNEWMPGQIAQLKEYGIYDAAQHFLPSQALTAPPMVTPTPSGSQARVSSTVSAASGSYARKSKNSTHQSAPSKAPPTSIKWANRSKLLSMPLEPWIEASAAAGEGHNDSLMPTWPGSKDSKCDWRGYAFPDPNMIANMSNDQIRNGALCSYVHHHPVLVYRIQTSADCGLKHAVWRANLVACTLRASAAGSTNDVGRRKAEAELNKAIKDAGFEGTISLQNLPDKLIWQGAYIDTSKPLSASIARSILSDMNEVEWRWELTNLDSKLYSPSPSSTDADKPENIDSSTPSARYSQEQRRLEVLQSITHFDGRYVPRPSFYKSSQGFASRKNSERVKALLQLVMVMDQWQGEWRVSGDVVREVKGLELMRQDELDTERMNGAVNRMERRVATHYVSAFKDVFNRAPTLPRETKTWPVV